ncbi:hypothetical protein BBM25_11795 [Vibrio parahaemolyticus]|nr:hypothetical protein [Vibrio parahaemolyticus]EGR3256943.1 hypothetical protein [Vibrio parahaemolyticus]KOY19986.1 hypothetical protein ACX12_21540 [Vibrio parahaemolyticus]KYY02426.1 hypothetical protein AWQ10_06245 [Vibrio parahaemolyticus]ODY52587.1 hypothetical protein BBM25_11795 [Vibrio parahaemolyticus]
MGFDNGCAVNRGIGRLWFSENLDGLDLSGFESTRYKHDCLQIGLAQSMKGINCLTQSLGSDVSLNQLLKN